MGVEIIRIKAVLSSAGLACWTGTELGNRTPLLCKIYLVIADGTTNLVNIGGVPHEPHQVFDFLID